MFYFIGTLIKLHKMKLNTEEELNLDFGVTNRSPLLPSHGSGKFL